MMRRKRETPCIPVDYSFFVLLSNWQTYDSEGFHAQKNQHIYIYILFLGSPTRIVSGWQIFVNFQHLIMLKKELRMNISKKHVLRQSLYVSRCGAISGLAGQGQNDESRRN